LKKTKYLFLLLLTGIMPSLFSGTAIYLISSRSNLLVNHTPAVLLLFFAGTACTMALALTPTTVIAIVSGYFFGWEGFPYLVFAYMLAAVIGIRCGLWLKKLGLSANPEKDSALTSLFKSLSNQEFLFIALARLSPILPFAMTNIALANLQIRLLPYLAGSLVGMLPRTLVFFYAGIHATDIWTFLQKPTLEGSIKIIPVLLVITSTLGLYYIIKKSLKRAAK
jgi:uncharacterized membrane protein YdjX (TVP38/TMEM64 family)